MCEDWSHLSYDAKRSFYLVCLPWRYSLQRENGFFFLIYRVRVRIDVYVIHSVIFPFLFVNIEKFCNKEKPLYMKKETLCLRRVDMLFKLV